MWFFGFLFIIFLVSCLIMLEIITYALKKGGWEVSDIKAPSVIICRFLADFRNYVRVRKIDLRTWRRYWFVFKFFLINKYYCDFSKSTIFIIWIIHKVLWLFILFCICYTLSEIRAYFLLGAF